MLNLRKDFELTCLFIMHDLAIAKYISDKIAMMSRKNHGDRRKTGDIFQPIAPLHASFYVRHSRTESERKRTAVELKGEVPSVIDIPRGCRFNPRCPYAEDRCKV